MSNSISGYFQKYKYYENLYNSNKNSKDSCIYKYKMNKYHAKSQMDVTDRTNRIVDNINNFSTNANMAGGNKKTKKNKIDHISKIKGIRNMHGGAPSYDQDKFDEDINSVVTKFVSAKLAPTMNNALTTIVTDIGDVRDAISPLYKTIINDCSANTTSLESEINTLKSDKTSLENDVNDLKKAVEDKTKEIEKLNGDKKALENTISLAPTQTKLDDLQKEIDEKEEKLADLRLEADKLISVLNVFKSKI